MKAPAISLREISTDGYQVVSGDLFVHLPRKSEPTCTLWATSITFSKTSISALNNCERVRIEINPKTKGMLIVPVTASDVDGIRWIKNVKDPQARKIDCKGFTSQLYEMWNWDTANIYRANGEVVTADKKVMLFFDFSKPETWKQKEKAKQNG